MKPYIYAYNNASESAQDLAEILGTRLIKHEKSKFIPSKYKVVINWGSSSIPLSIKETCLVLNHPEAVQVAKNKLSTFRALSMAAEGYGPRIPEWTEDRQVAQGWSQEGSTVVVRHILNGAEGRGIEIIEPPGVVPEAPLYTKYINKEREYRCHVIQGQVIDCQQKVRALEANNGNFRVRNHAAGFVFARTVNGLPVATTIPADCLEQSRRAVNWLGLFFGAVDVIWNNHRRQAYVLEVNTAPGIEGATLQNYNNEFRRIVDWNG